MRWDKEAENDLRKYRGLKTAIQNCEERIELLEAQSTSFHGATLNDIPVSGGGSSYEDKVLNNLVEREKKLVVLNQQRQLHDAIERGLAPLNNEEIKVLTSFYIEPQKRAADRLAAEIPCDRVTVYRIRNKALYKFTVAMYGFLES